MKKMNASQFQKSLLSLQGYMMSFAMTLTADRDDAMDLTQETSLRVLDNKEKFVDNRNFKGWVLTVMRNIFINNYKRVLRSQTVMEQDIDLYHLEASTESGIETPESACRMQEITRAIDELNEELRVPFTMYVSGYHYNEIADVLHIPLGTVKSRIFFARQALKNKLEER